ncbi:hypothetical protein ACHAWF_008745 [Thalassiosira exigua]
MSRWLQNVNALLENLDSQVEETVEEHRFNRTLSAAAARGKGGDGSGGEGSGSGLGGGGEGGVVDGVEELFREEARGVDDLLAKRGLLGREEEEDAGGEGVATGDGDGTVGEGGGEGTGAAGEGGEPKADAEKETSGAGSEEVGDAAKAEETVDFGGESTARAQGGTGEDLFAEGAAPSASAPESKGDDVITAQAGEESAPSSSDRPPAEDVTAATPVAASPAPKSGSGNVLPPPKSGSSAPSPPKSSSGTKTVHSAGATNAATLKELRRLRRHVLQLGSDLEASEREVEAQRAELDRAAARMERDRSRHKQEREAAEASRKAEVVGLNAAHERAVQQLKEAQEAALAEAEGRVHRAERMRAEEGGERDAELAGALERERAAVAKAAQLSEQTGAAEERIGTLTSEVSRLEGRLEHAESRADLSAERERGAEERLDKALSLHARQLGARQRREGELERTVADLGAALVVAKGKVEAAIRAGVNLDGDGAGRAASGAIEGEADDEADATARLQDLQDEVETLRVQLALERERCSALHGELRDLSRERSEETSEAHARQLQSERKVSDLTAEVARLESSLRRAGGEGGLLDDDAGFGEGGYAGEQRSGDEKKETDHLRKQIASLSERAFSQQAMIDEGRSEISTLRNRLRGATQRAEAAERGLEAANHRLAMADNAPTTSGMSSADEEAGLAGMTKRAAARKARRGFRRATRVESIRSSLGLLPGRHPAGSWREVLGALLDAVDALAVDLGSHLRHHPVSRLAFLLYLGLLHLWAFFLLVYHAHAQGTVVGEHHGPEALLRMYGGARRSGGMGSAGAAAAGGGADTTP